MLFNLLPALIILHHTSAVTDKVICYYQSWYAASFTVSDVEANICTHVIYAFLGVKTDGRLRMYGNDGVVKELRTLKFKNPNLKVMFGIGGWSEGSAAFSAVAAGNKEKEQMVSSALWFLKTYDYDGIDVDWEFPAKRGGVSADKKNFVDLLELLNKTLKESGDYILTIAVASNPHNGSYDVIKIANLVSYMSVMCYNFHEPSEGKTAQNGPLYASSVDSPWQKENANCHAAIQKWKEKGAPVSKLILGIAFYGRSFKLKDPNLHDLGAPISDSSGEPMYGEICQLQEGWTEVWNDEQKAPYKYDNTTWIGYDNPASIQLKLQYAKDQHLAGVMIWSISQDDKNATCGPKNALLRTVKDNIQ